ncbi:hypothetical protein OPV22_032120 [Ensete ventricosum]|uniref:PH domain-containing protein n=1 Tax=Ensete ventricosum TaxID=4639 RepID=A0AAV8PYE5_ENSVE|nr:hypothetical protein OPV22_032120 [Ensete ventricosum]
MYKRDHSNHRGIKPIRIGVVNHTFMVKELRCHNFSNRIVCGSAGEAHKWIEVFEQAKQQAEYNLLRGSSWHKLSIDN